MSEITGRFWMSERDITRLSMLAKIILLVSMAVLTVVMVGDVRDTRQSLQASMLALNATHRLMSALFAAETGQRGFLLTHEPAYLDPYEQARVQVPADLAQAERISAEDPEQRARLAALRPLVEAKLSELQETVSAARAGRFEEAEQRLRTGEGHQLMQKIREVTDAFQLAERQARDRRIEAAERAEQRTLLGMLAIVLLLSAIVVISGVLLRRTFFSLRHTERLAEATAQQLQVSFDSLSQGISVFDARCRLLVWNACFAELFNVPPRLLRVGAPYSAFIRHDWEDEEGDFLETAEQVAATPPETTGRTRPVTYERTRRDGRTFELRRTPLPGGGFVITYTDVSQRVQIDRQLQAAQRMEATGHLTGGVAHDFNNFLTIIIGNLELLRRSETDAQRRSWIDMALKGAERGTNLTQQLLAFARRQPLEPQPVDVTRLLGSLATLLRSSLSERIAIEVSSAAGLWTALADPAQLENAVLNLALNARDAMPDGGKLTIEAANTMLDDDYAARHAEVAAGAYVLIAVSDTGCGMPPAVVARAFDPFFTTKTDGKGTGLGLSQVFGFVKQSGGHVKIYSEPGEGTTVRLYLPRTQARPVQTPVSPEQGTSRGATVLIVEDDADVRRTAVAMLRDLGYQPLEAEDAQQALDVLAQPEPRVEVLFSDVVLPGAIRGNELAARAKALRPHLHVLFTSGYTQNAIVHDGRLDEGVVFLGKPYKRDDLARKLKQLLAKHTEPASSAGEDRMGSATARTEQMPEAGAARVPGDADVPPGEWRRRVLAVEDEPMVLWFVIDLLHGAGVDAVSAATAAAALQQLESDLEFDGMLVDFGLPDMSGDDLVREVRRQRPALPIVVASGYGADAAASALDGIANIAFLDKPYDGEVLIAAFRTAGLDLDAVRGGAG